MLAGATPAYIAAFYGFPDTLRVLDDLGADLDQAMQDGDSRRAIDQLLPDFPTLTIPVPLAKGATPLFIAAANGQVGAIRVLHELGADINKTTSDGASPAFIAAQEGQTDALRGAPNARAMHIIASESRCLVSFLEPVLGELGANVDRPDDDGASPACIAAQVRGLHSGCYENMRSDNRARRRAKSKHFACWPNSAQTSTALQMTALLRVSSFLG
jgi:hypothetical protein